ncbi:BNIP3 [Lepeophtheirus salmonis]|uniref:BNIP3 n=1 Tax=Lepeophtheirus salmonis TaxID=72036 RepID=A0A7R8H0Y8_LEPSM|nr:BNIP3 [Lepeophtheirus salmonis]CAF2798099.1 BNIP3 [Lepeophtheirus salmonis]
MEQRNNGLFKFIDYSTFGMTTTPPDVPLTDSWVDLSGPFNVSTSPLRVTPIPFGGEQDYLRMLREAQRESSRSSNKVSPISSAFMSLSSTCRNTPIQSPKSRPNTPNPDMTFYPDDLDDVYVNRIKNEDSRNGRLFMEMVALEEAKKYFSKKLALTVVLTNLISLIIGAGIGVWLCKRGGSNDFLNK